MFGVEAWALVAVCGDAVMAGALYCALVHHPVREKPSVRLQRMEANRVAQPPVDDPFDKTMDGAPVSTAITNLDVHDLSRSCRTFGVRRFFVVTPITAQRALVERILGHWSAGAAGALRVPDRAEALSLCAPCESIDRAMKSIEEAEGVRPRLWATAARRIDGVGVKSWADAAQALADDAGPPTLLLFGTGFGLHESVLRESDALLAPILGVEGDRGRYEHLSVRAAAAITLDRLRR